METCTFYYSINCSHNITEEGDSERALQSAFQEAERKAPSFLIVDQIDAIASNKDKVHSGIY